MTPPKLASSLSYQHLCQHGWEVGKLGARPVEMAGWLTYLPGPNGPKSTDWHDCALILFSGPDYGVWVRRRGATSGLDWTGGGLLPRISDLCQTPRRPILGRVGLLPRLLGLCQTSIAIHFYVYLVISRRSRISVNFFRAGGCSLQRLIYNPALYVIQGRW